jgi:hypothetical protein
VSARPQAPRADRRLRLVPGGGQAADAVGPIALQHAVAFRPRLSNATLALTEDDAPPPSRGPHLRLVADPADAPADPFDVSADAAPLGDGSEPVWLGEFLERAAAVLRERPRTVVQQGRGPNVREHLAGRRLWAVGSDDAAGVDRGVPDRRNVIELHGTTRRRA